MSTFALDTNSSSSDIISGLNYAIANLGQGLATATANVLVANVTNGEITTTSTNTAGYTSSTIVSYLYQYMAVKYANSATGGSGFSSNSANKSYYGLYNTANANPISSNPVDYSWFQVSGGFGTTKGLYYQTIGGRQVAFFAGNAAPTASFIAVPDMPTANSTPLNLDTVTAAQNNQIVITNAYKQGNTTPATPAGGSYNFVTYALTPPTGWSATIPTFVANTSVYVSTATFVGNTNNTSVPPNGDWSVPSVYTSQTTGNTGPAGSRGFVPMGFVITDSSPVGASTAQLTAWFSASRSNTSAPIGLGFAPIANDTAQFAYTDPFTTETTTVVEQYNGTSWSPVVGDVISGGLFVPGSINANTLNVNQVYAVTVQSTNANILNPASPGYWFQANTGNGRFGGNLSIGNYLTVGQNAQISSNLNVGASAVIGNNLTVGNNAVIGNSLLIGNSAVVGNNFGVGNNAAIGANLSIGNNATIGTNLIIGQNTQIGNNLTIGNSAVIGTNLTVGVNATIGGNLTVSGLITQGNLANNTVQTTTIIQNAVSSGQGISSATTLTLGSATNVYVPYTNCDLTLTTTIPLQQVYVNGILYVNIIGGSLSVTSEVNFILYRSVGTGNTGAKTLLYSILAQKAGNPAAGSGYAVPFNFFDVVSSAGTNTYHIGAVWTGSSNNPSFQFNAGTLVLQLLKR